jgi:hypothetical protein
VGFNTNKKAILLAILLRELKVSNNASVTLPFRRMKSGGAARRGLGLTLTKESP